jgi:hypothetical protein
MARNLGGPLAAPDFALPEGKRADRLEFVAGVGGVPLPPPAYREPALPLPLFPRHQWFCQLTKAQSFQKCLNLSGAKAVYRTVDAMLWRPGEGLLFDLRLIWCEGRRRPPHSQKAL